MNLVEQLEELKDLSYKKYSQKLKFGDKIIGVKIPNLRKIAKEILKNDVDSFLDNYKCFFHEEFLIYAIVLGQIEEKKKLKYTNKFVKTIDNWVVCDLFCGEIKAENLEKWRKQILPFRDSKKEFIARFYFVFGLKYFVNDEFVDDFLQDCIKNKNESYYVQMAVAWALCEIYVFHKDKVVEILKNAILDKFTHTKTISKICESKRVSEEEKEEIRLLRYDKIV